MGAAGVDITAGGAVYDSYPYEPTGEEIAAATIVGYEMAEAVLLL